MKLNRLRVECIMADKGIKTIDIARISGLSAAGVCRALKFESCKPITAGRIARALGVEVREIIKEA